MLRLSLKPILALLVFSISFTAFAQTFRGTLSGTVTDTQGAVISDAAVQLTNPSTGIVLNDKSNKQGDFNFPELPVGTYTLTVNFAGFSTKKVDTIDVAVTKVTNVKVELSVGSESTVVDVTANGVQTDTQSAALVAVLDSKSVQEMPMNGRNFTQMTHFAPGASSITNSVNGSRTASINFQVDGADNVDPWLGIVASNQGGIQSVAGGLIPIEAIDQFSMQSGGEADQGRNAGANSNMVLRSGTNKLHGDVFYFDRNEFFAAISPFAPVGARKTFIRNHQGGFTLGGPIWKDRTFFFAAGEIQIAKVNAALTDTVISDAWVSAGKSFINNYGITAANPLSLNLYGLLYPTVSKGGPATISNYFAQGTSNYNSYNGIIKLDHHFNDKEQLSVRYLGTTGTQTAPTASDYAEYFQTAPMHIHNFSVIQTSVINSKLLNVVTFATNYFLQTFNDANQNFNPQANAGLNLGIAPGIIAAGAPSILVTGFDQTGATQPSGRTDVTGHVTDNFHWTVGRHQLKFGGEYRHSNVNQLYFSSARGTFSFDGTRGAWYAIPVSAAAKTACATTGTGANCAAACAVTGACTPGSSPNAQALGYCSTIGISASNCANLGTLSDFLNGTPTNSNGAKLLQGTAQRVWTMNTYDAWAQDDFQASRRLSLNYGVRYTIPGVINAEANDIYQFVPGAAPGFQKGYYPEYYGGIAPRVGFSYSVNENNNTVIRGSYGIFYDFPAMSSWITGTTTNGGANYAQNNPAGPDAAAIFVQNSNVQWQPNVNPFASSVAPQVGAFGVNQNFKMPRATVVSLNVEQQLTKSTLFTVGYVGSFGQHLEVLYDLNQPVASGTTTANARPYLQTSFPNENAKFVGKPLVGINQLNFEAASNYHSLQATVKQAAWKGIQTTLNYTWSKSMDDSSSNTTPMNSYNLHQDYGPSTFDNRHLLNGFVYYSVPQLFHAVPKLTKGFQLNAIYTYSSGVPISPQYSTNVDGTGELKDRPNFTGVNPYVSGAPLATSTASGRQYRWLTNANGSFTTPATGTYGNERRDAFTGPNFRTIDFSLFKHTPVTEKIMSEFRVEIFNIMNFNNFANPAVNPASGTFGLITNTRNGAAAPGIGYGEPFNIQFALKLSF
ncbi:TonB-dependent receptor [Granulicella arctica]|uniref:TonB-dependent receptor n=1 Tax=Granulicella arctica TaxID=940613 RepID=UPI0021E069BA|nr:TonB-dependent receptor [Granulicella arctica]